jgi:hypothetical protein
VAVPVSVAHGFNCSDESFRGRMPAAHPVSTLSEAHALAGTAERSAPVATALARPVKRCGSHGGNSGPSGRRAVWAARSRRLQVPCCGRNGAAVRLGQAISRTDGCRSTPKDSVCGHGLPFVGAELPGARCGRHQSTGAYSVVWAALTCAGWHSRRWAEPGLAATQTGKSRDRVRSGNDRPARN